MGKNIYLELLEYIVTYGILPTSQSGSRRSFTTALINLTDDISRALERKLCVILIWLEFSKAFDEINIKLLCA